MIPLAKPDLRKEDLHYLTKVLESGFLVQGKYVDYLEKVFAESACTEYALAVSNGTATMHLGLLALGIGKGDEVIVPAFSYVATANVVELVGATPIFVDIDIHTFNIDPKKIEEKVTKKTKAIIGVHEFGLAFDIDAVAEIAERHNLHLLEDAACAYGAKYKGKHVGGFGTWGSFSLHPRKAITTGEGGVLCTNDKNIADFIRVNRNHGLDASEGFISAGFNYRMTDVQASLFVGQHERLEANLNFKKQLAATYKENIRNEMFKLPVVPDYLEHAWQSFHLLVEEGVDRDKIIKRLYDAGIQCNYGAQCIPEMKFYKTKYHYKGESPFPNAYKAYTNGLVIPHYYGLKPEQIDSIIDALNKM